MAAPLDLPVGNEKHFLFLSNSGKEKKGIKNERQREKDSKRVSGSFAHPSELHKGQKTRGDQSRLALHSVGFVWVLVHCNLCYVVMLLVIPEVQLI